MGGTFKREGTYVYLWLIHVDIWQKSNHYCKAIILPLKINKLNIKNRFCSFYTILTHFCDRDSFFYFIGKTTMVWEVVICPRSHGQWGAGLGLLLQGSPSLSTTVAVAAAAAAKSLQLCRILCDPIDGSPPGSPIPGILQARTLEWVVISFSNAWKWRVKVSLLSCVCLLVTPWTAAYQAPPSMGFSRQESWSGVTLSSPPVQ